MPGTSPGGFWKEDCIPGCVGGRPVLRPMGPRGGNPDGSRSWKTSHPLRTVCFLLRAPRFSGSLFWPPVTQDQPFQALRTAQGERLGSAVPLTSSTSHGHPGERGLVSGLWTIHKEAKAGGLGARLHQARKNATVVTPHGPAAPGPASPRLRTKTDKTDCLFRSPPPATGPMPKDGTGVCVPVKPGPAQPSRLSPSPLAGQRGPFLSAHRLPFPVGPPDPQLLSLSVRGPRPQLASPRRSFAARIPHPARCSVANF